MCACGGGGWGVRTWHGVEVQGGRLYRQPTCFTVICAWEHGDGRRVHIHCIAHAYACMRTCGSAAACHCAPFLYRHQRVSLLLVPRTFHVRPSMRKLFIFCHALRASSAL